MIALAALFAMWAAAYAAQAYDAWSAANPDTRLGPMPTAKNSTVPVGGIIRQRRQNMLTTGACAFGSGAYTYSTGTRGHLYLTAVCGISAIVPTLIVLTVLTIRHNRRVGGRQSSEVQRRPLPRPRGG